MQKNCIICESRDTNRTQKVVKCNFCGHVYRDYGNIDLENYYTNEYRKKPDSTAVANKPSDSVLEKRNKEKFRLVKDHLTSCQNLLEVGFGRGHFWRQFSENEANKQYYCCEIDLGLAEEAEKKKVNVFKSKFQDIEPKFLFDAVVSFDVLEHFNNPCEYKEKLLTVLKPNGLAVIQVPVDRALHSRDPFDGHYNYFSKKSLEIMMGLEFDLVDAIKTKKGQVAGGNELLTIFRKIY